MHFQVLRAFDRRRLLLRGLAALVLTVAMLSQTVVCVAAQRANSVAPQTGEVLVKGTQAILMDAETGGVLYARGPDEPMYPSNMAKLMTLAVVFKALKAGDVKPDDQLFMSEFAWRRGGAPSGNAAMFVPVGTKASVDDLIKGIVIQSANDAAISIAENLGGNENQFARRMTEEARQIGLKKSVFRNATGFHDPAQYMTAREIALLARHIIITYPEQYQLFAQKEFAYRTHKFYNRNPLLTLVPGADGLSLGFTKEAGYSIVASAKQDNRRLIVVVGGCSTADERRDDARRLLEWGLRNFQEMKLYEAGEVVSHARVWGGERLFVPLAGESDINVWLPRAPGNQKVRASVVYNWPLKAPVNKGDQVATLRVTAGTEATSEVPLYAAVDVQRGGIMRRGLDTLLYLATRWIP